MLYIELKVGVVKINIECTVKEDTICFYTRDCPGLFSTFLVANHLLTKTI